jgi:predicted NBD/HSP70 family sugar kinase
VNDRRQAPSDTPYARRGRMRRRALPGDARRHNQSLVLRSISRDGPLSRADLARATHLTRAATSELIAELLSAGLVEELGVRAERGVGKPATLLGLVPDARLTIAVDLSDDTTMRAALVDLTGKIVVRQDVDRGGATGRGAVDLVTGLCRGLVAEAERPLLGIGVGSPGVVDAAGEVVEAPNLGWYDVALAVHLGDVLDVPVHVANDANAAALAELGLAGHSDRSLLVVKIGQGVGAGVVLDGHLVLGDGFAAGEIGHVVVDPHGDRCACGRVGCLETAIAAPHVRRRALADGPDVALSTAGLRLGEALAPVIGALNLREIVLSGPSDVLDERFRSAAVATIRQRTLPAIGDHVDLRFSSLGEDDVLLGAAMLVLDRELGIA